MYKQSTYLQYRRPLCFWEGHQKVLDTLVRKERDLTFRLGAFMR